MCVFCLNICKCTVCLPGTRRGQKRVSEPLELEFQRVVSSHVNAGIGIQDVGKSSKCRDHH